MRSLLFVLLGSLSLSTLSSGAAGSEAPEPSASPGEAALNRPSPRHRPGMREGKGPGAWRHAKEHSGSWEAKRKAVAGRRAVDPGLSSSLTTVAGILSVLGAGLGVAWRGSLLAREWRRPGSSAGATDLDL